MNKLNVVLLFGGKSTEHEVSVRSARSIFEALDPNKYNVIPVAISKSGTWVRGAQVMRALKELQPVIDAEDHISFLPDPTNHSLMQIDRENRTLTPDQAHVNVVLPILHGKYGEDGALQGLLEMANVAYVGCGVLSSALGMDKIKHKEVLSYYGIPVTEFVATNKLLWSRDRERILSEVEEKLGSYPVFVKPANTGSSVGINKAKNRSQLIDYINVALEFDFKVIVEQGLDNIREIETSVLGNWEPKASVCGEIFPGNEFYDYEAKYFSEKTTFKLPADLPEPLSNQIRSLACKAYQALDCRGLARVDFFVSRDSNPKVWLNEINTMPGFTSMSIYPKLWEASGVSYRELVERLISLAVEEWEEKQKLRTSHD